MGYEKHRRAWNVLSAVPTGRLTDHICDAILAQQEKDSLAEVIRQTIHAELQHCEVIKEQPKEEEDAIDGAVIDFILALQKGAET